jgi:hypothetical protein
MHIQLPPVFANGNQQKRTAACQVKTIVAPFRLFLALFGLFLLFGDLCGKKRPQNAGVREHANQLKYS